jgi:Putative zinc ribbon domain
MFKPRGPYCQSCGMPMSKDPEGGGTEADGSKSREYCSHCYQNGGFTEPDLTAQQMVQKVSAKLREMHFPGFIAKRFTREIPDLKRWKPSSQA